MVRVVQVPVHHLQPARPPSASLPPTASALLHAASSQQQDQMLKALCGSPPRTFSAKFMGRLRRLRTTCSSNSRLSTQVEHSKLYETRTG